MVPSLRQEREERLFEIEVEALVADLSREFSGAMPRFKQVKRVCSRTLVALINDDDQRRLELLYRALDQAFPASCDVKFVLSYRHRRKDYVYRSIVVTVTYTNPRG